MSALESPKTTCAGYRQIIETDPEAFSPLPPRASVPGGDFRSAMSQLAAGTSVVTMCGPDGEKLGLTATAVTSVSLDPPLVLVCINNRARTAAALQACVPFIIHFLAADQEALARRFASPIADKFAEVAHRMTPSGCPQLAGALASVECVPHQVYPGGDHIIVVGRVVDVQVNSDTAAPLVYFRHHFLNQPH